MVHKEARELRVGTVLPLKSPAISVRISLLFPFDYGGNHLSGSSTNRLVT